MPNNINVVPFCNEAMPLRLPPRLACYQRLNHNIASNFLTCSNIFMVPVGHHTFNTTCLKVVNMIAPVFQWGGSSSLEGTSLNRVSLIDARWATDTLQPRSFAEGQHSAAGDNSRRRLCKRYECSFPWVSCIEIRSRVIRTQEFSCHIIVLFPRCIRTQLAGLVGLFMGPSPVEWQGHLRRSAIA